MVFYVLHDSVVISSCGVGILCFAWACCHKFLWWRYFFEFCMTSVVIILLVVVFYVLHNSVVIIPLVVVFYVLHDSVVISSFGGDVLRFA